MDEIRTAEVYITIERDLSEEILDEQDSSDKTLKNDSTESAKEFHKRSKTSIKSITCPLLCKKKFVSQTGLKCHLKWKHSNNVLDWAFNLELYKQKHDKDQNMAIEKTWICQICDTSFNAKKSLNKHFKRKHPESRNATPLLIKEKTECLTINSEIEKGGNCTCTSDDLSVKCLNCKEDSIKHNNLRNQKMLTAQTMKYKCQECNQTFPTIDKYKTHNRNSNCRIKLVDANDIVRKIGDHPCTICKKKFLTGAALERHTNRCHLNGKKSRHSRKVADNSGLKKLKEESDKFVKCSNEVEIKFEHDIQEQPYLCVVCQSTFASEIELMDHANNTHEHFCFSNELK